MWRRGYERTSTSLCYTKTWVCWRITQGCCSRGRERKTAKQFSPLISFSSLLLQNVSPCHRAIPEASAVHQQLLAPAAGPSICKVIASNQGPQQTNPDRYSHLRFTLGQLWCHPKGVCVGGRRRGKPAVGVMYAECLHVLDDSDTSACHRRHQFYLVTALQGNPYDCSAVRTLLIVIYLSGVIMLSREWQKRKKNGQSPKSGEETGSAEHLIWPFGPFRPQNSPPISSPTLLPLACAADQSVARPTVYVTGIIRISYGAGKAGGGLEGFHSWDGGEETQS